MIIAGAAAALVPAQRARMLLAGLVLVIDAGVLFAIPMFSAPRSVRVDTQPVAFLERHLGTSRFFTLGPIAPNYGAYFGTGSLNINDLPIPSSFSNYVRRRLDPYADPTVFTGGAGGRARSHPRRAGSCSATSPATARPA